MVGMTWGHEVEAWARHLRAGGRPSTTIGLRTYHIARLGRAIGGEPWSTSADDLIGWFGEREWARDTRRSWRSSCRAFWAWGVATGRTSSNPALALESIRPGDPRPKPTADAIYKRALLAAAPRERLMLRLAAEAGMRRGEVAKVHRRDLFEDLDGWSIVVHGKGDKPRLVPLSGDLARDVKVATRHGWAFPGQVDGHLSPAWVGKVVSRLMPDGVAMHSLRHRFATRAYRFDRDLLTVQALLGHASPDTTKRYVETDRDALRRTVLAAAG